MVLLGSGHPIVGAVVGFGGLAETLLHAQQVADAIERLEAVRPFDGERFQFDDGFFDALHAAQGLGHAQTRRPGKRRRRVDPAIDLDGRPRRGPALP